MNKIICLRLRFRDLQIPDQGRQLLSSGFPLLLPGVQPEEERKEQRIRDFATSGAKVQTCFSGGRTFEEKVPEI